MLFVLIGCVLFCVASCQIETLGYENTNDGSGNYRFSFITANGINREETGRLVNNGEDESLVVQGTYSYIDPDGNEVVVRYIADGNGFRVVDSDADETPPILESSLPANVVASLLGK